LLTLVGTIVIQLYALSYNKNAQLELEKFKTELGYATLDISYSKSTKEFSSERDGIAQITNISASRADKVAVNIALESIDDPNWSVIIYSILDLGIEATPHVLNPIITKIDSDEYFDFINENQTIENEYRIQVDSIPPTSWLNVELSLPDNCFEYYSVSSDFSIKFTEDFADANFIIGYALNHMLEVHYKIATFQIYANCENSNGFIAGTMYLYSFFDLIYDYAQPTDDNEYWTGTATYKLKYPKGSPRPTEYYSNMAASVFIDNEQESGIGLYAVSCSSE